jgi:type I restriction enzyme S subunit
VSNWIVQNIGNLASVKGGKRLPKGHDYTGEVTEHPYLRVVDFKNNTIDGFNLKYLTKETASQIERYTISCEDVYISIAGTIGLVGTIPPEFDKANLTENAAKLVINDKSIIDKNYLVTYLSSTVGQKQIQSKTITTTQPKLALFRIEELEIPLPPLEIQKQIAKTLDTTAELLTMRKQQLAELDNLIESTFYDMFGDPVTNEKRWVVEKLMDVTTKIGSGATPKGGKESYQDDGISLIRSMNVHNGVFKYEQLAHINDEQAKQLNNVIVKENDVLINITGASVARSCIVPSGVLPARVNQHVSIVRLNEEKANPEYINNMFTSNSFQTQLLSIGGAGGATREAITKQQLQDLVIPLPPLPLQIHFSSIVTKNEEQKALVKKAIDETQYLFDSLMSEYFE